MLSEKGSQVVVESGQALFKDLPHDELVGHLNTIQKYCKTNLAQRVLATDNGAYSVLVKLVQSSEKVNVLKTLTVVMDTNPGHLETQEVNLLNSLLLEHGVGEDIQAVMDFLLICYVRCKQSSVCQQWYPGQAVGDGDQGGEEGGCDQSLQNLSCFGPR